jgi:hypothetical protein
MIPTVVPTFPEVSTTSDVNLLQAYVHAVKAAFFRRDSNLSVNRPMSVQQGHRARAAAARVASKMVQHRIGRSGWVDLEPGSEPIRLGDWFRTAITSFTA